MPTRKTTTGTRTTSRRRPSAKTASAGKTSAKTPSARRPSGGDADELVGSIEVLGAKDNPQDLPLDEALERRTRFAVLLRRATELRPYIYVVSVAAKGEWIK